MAPSTSYIVVNLKSAEGTKGKRRNEAGSTPAPTA